MKTRNNLSSSKNIIWFKINKKGSIKGYIKNIPGIYIFANKHNEYYVGSSCKLSSRFSKHKYNVNNNKKGCPKFYKSVSKLGWNHFKVGILEYVYLPIILSKKDIKTIRLIEQKYINKIKPTLNIRMKIIKTYNKFHQEKLL